MGPAVQRLDSLVAQVRVEGDPGAHVTARKRGDEHLLGVRLVRIAAELRRAGPSNSLTGELYGVGAKVAVLAVPADARAVEGCGLCVHDGLSLRTVALQGQQMKLRPATA